MRLAVCFLVLAGFGYLFTAASPTRAQTGACPVITVSCPGEKAEERRGLMIFTANVKGASNTAKLKYRWTVSDGTIESGQDEPSVTVNVVGLNGKQITATVEVEGLAASCPAKASCSTEVAMPIGCLRLFDQYGELDVEDEAARLDNFAIQLESERTVNAYILAYDGRNVRAGRAEARANRAKHYLMERRGIDRERIFVIAGGYREDMTFELFIMPQGLEAPSASPTLSPEEAQSTETTRKGGPRRDR